MNISIIKEYIYSFSLTTYCDAAFPWQIGFQNPATPIMEGIILLHHHIMFFLTIVVIFVMYMLYQAVTLFTLKKPYILGLLNKKNIVTHAPFLEIVWTVTPSLILLLIAVPSFGLLYSMEEIIDPALTIKVVGHQWYWSYEYSDFFDNESTIAYSSYMVPTEDLNEGELRLLTTDASVLIPTGTHVRLLITSEDVLHSWAVPSLGIKVDAIPGRINQASVFLLREGTFYGQCSEICGVNHAFMPITIAGVSSDVFYKFIKDSHEALAE
jgi:cytochrome c oxidase subunit 2